MKRLLHFYVYALAGFLLSPFLIVAQDIHFEIVAGTQENMGTGTIILSMTQDEQGYLWFGTTNGLYKYDGVHFIPYHNQSSNPNSLALEPVECVTPDKEGHIWLGHWHGTIGLERLDPVTGIFTHFSHHKNDDYSLANDSVSVILQGKDGTIWIGTNDGLDKFDRKTNKFFHYRYKVNDSSSLSCNHVRALFEDKQGTLWVGTGNAYSGDNPKDKGGLNKLNKKTGKFTRYLHNEKDDHSLIDDRIRAIFEDSRGNFWVGSAGDGLHKMDRATGKFERLLYDPSHPEKLSRPRVHELEGYLSDHITFITEDIKGRIWIGTMTGGINVYDSVTQKCTYYGRDKNSKERLFDNDFWTAYKTSDGVIWICAWQSNVYKINPYQNKLPYTNIGKYVLGFAEDSEHTLWMATSKGLIHKDSSGNYQQFLISKDIHTYKNVIFRIESDDANRIWVQTFDGKIFIFNPATKAFMQYHAKNGSSEATNIYWIQKNRGSQLLLLNSQGLQLKDIKTGIVKNYQYDPQYLNWIINDGVHFTATDSIGNLWIGLGLSLSKLDKQTGHFKKYPNQIEVHAVMNDSEGNLWTAAQGGLFKFDKSSDNFILFTDRSSLIKASTWVYWITEDNEQNLWLNTSKGIIKLNKERTESILFRTGQELNENSYTTSWIYARQNGEILLGDTSGYYHFSNSQLQQNIPPPIVIINNFLLNDLIVQPGVKEILSKPLEQTKEIRLNHDQNTFSFEFLNIDFINNPEETRILYTMQNYDNKWRNANDSRTAYYFNLPPGKYIFKVKAGSSNGSWTEKNISVIIAPPWWKTWWFYILCALTVAFILYAIYRYRMQQVIKLQIMRNNIASDLHDDIGSTLNSISIFSEVAKQQAGKNIPALDQIGESARKIVESMSDIVWTINPENDSLEKVIVRMRSFAYQVLKAKKIDMVFRADEILNRLTLPMQVRKNFYLIFKEATNNIVKYSDASRVLFQITYLNRQIKLEIRDNGKGFCLQQPQEGNGIKNMKRRANEIGAILQIDSAEGEGTSIGITVKT